MQRTVLDEEGPDEAERELTRSIEAADHPADELQFWLVLHTTAVRVEVQKHLESGHVDRHGHARMIDRARGEQFFLEKILIDGQKCRNIVQRDRSDLQRPGVRRDRAGREDAERATRPARPCVAKHAFSDLCEAVHDIEVGLRPAQQVFEEAAVVRRSEDCTNILPRPWLR